MRAPPPDSRPGKDRSVAPPAAPSFTKGYPADPRLDALVSAFVAGNYAAVRAGAKSLGARLTVGEDGGRDGGDELNATNRALREAAADLVARTEADPVAKLLLLATLALLGVLSAYWTLHGHG